MQPLSPSSFGENQLAMPLDSAAFNWSPQARALGASGGARRSRRAARRSRRAARKAMKNGGTRHRSARKAMKKGGARRSRRHSAHRRSARKH